MSTLALKITNVDFHYADHIPVFNQFGIDLRIGERVGLTGPNGSGKSTLFQLLMGFRKPLTGSLEWFGMPVSTESEFARIRRRVGLLFQQADDQLFCATVGDEVAFGPFNLGLSREEVRLVVEETLASLNLHGFASRITYHLSEGEKRLVSLASVLAMKPEVLLLDEPTNGLDDSSRTRLIQLLKTLPQTMLIASHDLPFLNELTTRCITIVKPTVSSRMNVDKHG